MRGNLILTAGALALAFAGAAVGASSDVSKPKARPHPHRPAPVSLQIADACNGATGANKATCFDVVCGELGDYNQGYVNGSEVTCYWGAPIHYP